MQDHGPGQYDMSILMSTDLMGPALIFLVNNKSEKVRIAIYEVLHVCGSKVKSNTYLSICDCTLTIALLKLSKGLRMKLIHEAG